jgi:integrase
MSLSRYLTKRPNSQFWQLRLMVPKPARPLVGRAEFTKSLRVTDKGEAERLAHQYLHIWKGEIARALGKEVPEAVPILVDAQPNGPLATRVDLKSERVGYGSETILALFDRYRDQRSGEKRKRADTLNQDQKVIQHFCKFVGEGREIASVTRNEVREWRDALSVLPPNHAKMKAFMGLSIREAANKAREENMSGMSLTTVNKYLSTLSPLYSWARRHGYVEYNPCDGLFYDIVKGRNRRPSFSDEQIIQIFCSPLFTGFLEDGKEWLPGERRCDDWRYWIPFVCFFTGARIGEIAQLFVDDIVQEDDTWIIYIRDDEKRGQTTKSGYTRFVPIHSFLEAKGFVQFVESQKERANRDSNRRIFPELRANIRGHVGAIPSRFWRKYLQKLNIKNGNDGIGAHSFRHTVADYLRAAGFLDDEIEVALGHNQKTITSGYGELRQGTIRRLHDMFESLTYPNIPLGIFLNHEGFIFNDDDNDYKLERYMRASSS